MSDNYKRVKVVYSLIKNDSTLDPLVGQVRWLCPIAGKLYRSIDDSYSVNCGFITTQTRGLWRQDSSGDCVQEVVDKEQPQTPLGYPDGNPKSAQGAKKFSLRYLPLSANIAVNQALEDGAKKYGPANWREKSVATSVYVDAALRHISLYFDCKQNLASDSNVHNLGHAMACLAIIIDAEQAGTLIDDRPFPFPDGDAALLRPTV